VQEKIIEATTEMSIKLSVEMEEERKKHQKAFDLK
jgi:hypothetical protein